MKNIRKYKSFVFGLRTCKQLVLFTLLFITGCKKFVEIQPPTTQLVTASVFNDDYAATSAQIGIYLGMVSNAESYNLALDNGMLSDELTYYQKRLSLEEYYHNDMVSTYNPGPWSRAYNYIYQANAIIAAIQNNLALSPGVVNQLTGESKFIRAFWFFYLTNLYGDIPLVTTTDYTVNATLARTARNEVYQQIVSDLKAAKALMNPNYIDATDTTVTTTDRTRPNKWAASALLSRVYLYIRDYPDAISEADSVLNNPLYSLCPNLNNVFLVNSSETIWQLDIPQPSNYNTPDGQFFILLSQPNGSSPTAIAPQLLNSFEPGDSRRTNWIDSFQTTRTPIVTYYFPHKYKVQSSETVSEDVMVLRLAEQYLIRAEAEVNLGDSTDAINDLNTVRNRANLNNYTSVVQGPLLTAILHERQVELFTEWGHRWFDLIRTNSANTVMSVVTPVKGGVWNSTGDQELYPIPPGDIKIDVYLTQNPGYN